MSEPVLGFDPIWPPRMSETDRETFAMHCAHRGHPDAARAALRNEWDAALLVLLMAGLNEDSKRLLLLFDYHSRGYVRALIDRVRVEAGAEDIARAAWLDAVSPPVRPSIVILPPQETAEAAEKMAADVRRILGAAFDAGAKGGGA